MQFIDEHGNSAPRTIADLMELNDSAARNVIDMINAGEIDPADANHISRIYWAHEAEFRGNQW